MFNKVVDWLEKPHWKGIGRSYSLFVGVLWGWLFTFTAMNSHLNDIPDESAIPENLEQYIDYLENHSPQKKFNGFATPETNLLQLSLIALGYDIGGCGADGIFEEKSRKAIEQFKKDAGLKSYYGFGLWDVQKPTFSELMTALKADEEAYQSVESELITQFNQNTSLSDFENHPVFESSYGWQFYFDIYSLAHMYRLQVLNIYERLKYGEERRQIKDSIEIMGDCYNFQARDAIRHFRTMYSIYQWGIHPKSAERMMNFRERAGDNKPSIALLDVFNHERAVEAITYYEDNDIEFENATAFLKQANADGYLVTVPVPLISREYADSMSPKL